MSSTPRAGWYPDHQAPDGHLRYWDGAGWTDERSLVPLPRATEESAIGERVQRLAAGVVVAAFVVAVAVVFQNQQTQAPEAGPAARDPAPAPAAGDPGLAEVPDSEPTPEESSTPEVELPESTPSPEGRSGPMTWRVASVLDAGTLRLSNGAVVRLVGLEAPEEGDCVADEAVEFLTRLVDGQRVALRRPGADKDGKGRLLRYVLIGRSDIGLRMLRQGLVTARERPDAGDEPHPREGTYVRAAAAAPLPKCSGGSVPSP